MLSSETTGVFGRGIRYSIGDKVDFDARVRAGNCRVNAEYDDSTCLCALGCTAKFTGLHGRGGTISNPLERT